MTKTIKNKVKNLEIKAKIYYDFDGIEYNGIRDINNLHYKPKKINNAFNDDYIEHQSNGDKNEILSVKQYLDMLDNI